MWTLLRTRAGEDREVTTGVNWATGRSLVAWTGAGVSPEGLTPCSPQAVGPSRQHLQGEEQGMSPGRVPEVSGLQTHLLPDGPLSQG